MIEDNTRTVEIKRVKKRQRKKKWHRKESMRQNKLKAEHSWHAKIILFLLAHDVFSHLHGLHCYPSWVHEPLSNYLYPTKFNLLVSW